MHTSIKQNKQFMIAAFTIIFMSILYYLFYTTTRKPGPKISKTENHIQLSPIVGDNPKILEQKYIPTLAPHIGEGIDMTSQIAQNSTGNINVIEPHLPYEKNMTTSNGIDVTVYIPRREFQDSPWTLTIYMYGINFKARSGSEEDKKMQQAFYESADHVFNWIREKNTDPEQIIFRWDEKEYVNKKVEEWYR